MRLTEKEELELKNKILKYIKSSLNFQGDEKMVEKKVIDLTVGIYEIVISLR